MVTTTNNAWGNMFETGDTVMTNKGQKPAPKLRKCAKCDETIRESDESCPQCSQLTEDAKPLLLD